MRRNMIKEYIEIFPELKKTALNVRQWIKMELSQINNINNTNQT